MTEFILGIVVIVAYRAFTIACGLVIVYFGFVLFRLGVYEKAGELKAAWGTKNLTLKQAAPGTFFALFGAGVIAVSVWKGVDFESVRTQAPPPTQQSEANAPGSTPAVSSPPASDNKKAPEIGPKATSDSWLDKLIPEESKIHYKAFRAPGESDKELKLLPDSTKDRSG